MWQAVQAELVRLAALDERGRRMLVAKKAPLVDSGLSSKNGQVSLQRRPADAMRGRTRSREYRRSARSATWLKAAPLHPKPQP